MESNQTSYPSPCVMELDDVIKALDDLADGEDDDLGHVCKEAIRHLQVLKCIKSILPR